jgi:CRP-like cAMP-binding protein
MFIPGLEHWSRPATFDRGDVLVRQGDSPGVVRLLGSGIASVTALVKDRSGGVRSPLLALRTSGSVLGGVPAVLGGPHVASVTAITPCETRTQSVDAFRRLIVRGGDPDVAEWLVRQQSREIREQIRRAIALATKNQEDHFVWLIVYLFQAAHHREADGSLTLTFPLTVTDMATAMGAARSPVSVIVSSYLRRELLLRPRFDLWVIPPTSRLHRTVVGEDE